jgi:MFS family permease
MTEDLKADYNPNTNATKGTLLLCSSLTIVSGAIVAPALPVIRDHFAHIDNADFLVTLILTLPALFIVIGGPLAGMVIDLCHRKNLLLGSVILYAIAGTSGLVTDSLGGILVGRALLGLAVAGIMTSVSTLIADYYQGTDRVHLMGLQSTFRSFGGVVFLPLGGILADVSWRGPFLVYGFALLLVPFIALRVYEPREACEEEQESKSGDPTQAARLPVALLVVVYAVILFVQILFFLVPVFLPFYLESITSRASGTQTGFSIAVFAFCSAIAALLYRRVREHLDYVPVIAIALALMGAGFVAIGTASTYPQVLAGLAVSGAGMGLVMPNLNLWLANETPLALRGRALGGFTTFLYLGQFMSPIVTAPVRELFGLGPTYALAGGFMLVVAAAFVAGQGLITRQAAST